ncbi:MAG: VOC family protein [Candidatus Hydrogenedentes bacterium]|nr:VOC family protein [Candidatus Hydrogenedentota bacterium]MBI3117406.1 VOC family protein [Candidatus Hydrogenedentota bacterium]
MICGVDNVFYFVSDMGRAAAFYRDVLGLTPICLGDNWSTFDVGGFTLGLHSTQGRPLLQNVVGEKGVIAGAQVTLRVDDVHRAYAELTQRGVEFVTPVIEQPWADLAKFVDPDGNRLNLRRAKP